MHFFIVYSTKLLKRNPTPLKTLSMVCTLFQRNVSQSSSMPKKQQRIRDHGFDNYMEVEKKMRKVLKFQDLVLSQPSSMLTISRLDTLSRGLGNSKPAALSSNSPMFSKYLSTQFREFSIVGSLAEPISKWSGKAQVPDAVTWIGKLLVLSNTGCLRLEHVLFARKEFGLPDVLIFGNFEIPSNFLHCLMLKRLEISTLRLWRGILI